jgi:hypothetical protein
VLITDSPTAESTSNAPITEASNSKASAGTIVAIAAAMLALAAIFAIVLLFRRNRHKKDAEGGAFHRSFFGKSSVKLDYAGVNPTPSPYPHSLAAIMIERRVDIVRSPSISSYEDVEQGKGIPAYGQPASDSLQEQRCPSYSSSPADDVTPPHHPRTLTPSDTKNPS